MKYRRLPVEKELASISADRGDDAAIKARAAYVDALLRHPGFQILITLLRDIEASAMEALRSGRVEPDKALARISTVDYIRKAIADICPSTPVDWHNDEVEEFLPPDIVGPDWEF